MKDDLATSHGTADDMCRYRPEKSKCKLKNFILKFYPKMKL